MPDDQTTMTGVSALATIRREMETLRAERNEARAEGDALKAATDRVRRMAQVWVDIRPVHPTATREGHVMADAGEQVIAALHHTTEGASDGR